MGAGAADDAGVYLVSEELALIQTVDFFTPIVDDPYDFGRIAAANALSDIYAMGGVPKTAMNIVAYPMERLGREPLRAMLAGGASILREAGTVLLGGHSVEDEELKYGLSVTGYVHPDRIVKNQGLKDGDCLILTKALGTGIINTAIKGGLAEQRTIELVTASMTGLNRDAAEVMGRFSVSACTDVTGFGFLGHLAEMIEGTGKRVIVSTVSVPRLEGAYDFAAMGLVPAGAHKNRNHRQAQVEMAADFDPVLRDILFDPQTSGGLLIGVSLVEANDLLRELHSIGVKDAAIVGQVEKADKAVIELQ